MTQAELFVFSIKCPTCKRNYKAESDMNELKLYSPCPHCDFDGNEDEIEEYHLEGSILIDLDTYVILLKNRVVIDNSGSVGVSVLVPLEVQLDYLLENEEEVINLIDEHDSELIVKAENGTVLVKSANVEFLREYLQTVKFYGLE